MATTSLDASDLFVMLERAFRRETRNCPQCTFSLPFRIDCPHGANWTVVPSNCSPACESALEDVMAKLQRKHRLR